MASPILQMTKYHQRGMVKVQGLNFLNFGSQSMWAEQQQELKMERSGPENRVSGSDAVSGLNQPLTIRSNLTIDWFRKIYNPHSAVNFQIDCLEHKKFYFISRNQFFSGNDFKDFASFNSCFYHLDIAFVKWFLHHWNRLHLSTGICIMLIFLQNLTILAKICI